MSETEVVASGYVQSPQCDYCLQRSRRKGTRCQKVATSTDLRGKRYCLHHFRMMSTSNHELKETAKKPEMTQSIEKPYQDLSLSKNDASSSDASSSDSDDTKYKKKRNSGGKRKRKEFSNRREFLDGRVTTETGAIDFARLERQCLKSIKDKAGWAM